jgi:hypothetical protein
MPTITKATKTDVVYSHDEIKRLLSWEAFGHYDADIFLTTINDEPAICVTETVETESNEVSLRMRK